MQSLRYLQGFAYGDGWVYTKLNRFKLHIYDSRFAAKVRRIQRNVKANLGLSGSEWHGRDHRTGRPVWIFEVGGRLATERFDLSLLRSPEGLFFLAGLWDADGNWSAPDESHPLGQTRLFGGWHTISYTKRSMRHIWGFATGRMSIATPEGHTSRIGDHVIHTRVNVYGTGILAKSMAAWVAQVGSKMLLKRRIIEGR